jgi:hypothetical protein
MRFTPLDAARLSDRELVDVAYNTVQTLDDSDEQDLLFVLFSEAFERWAPEADMAGVTRRHLAEEPTRERALFEIAGAIEGMRARAAARLEARLARGGAHG